MDDALVENCALTIARVLWGSFRDDLSVSLVKSLCFSAAREVLRDVEASRERGET